MDTLEPILEAVLIWAPWPALGKAPAVEIPRMTFRSALAALAAAGLMAATLPASAVTIRYANQGDLKALDPYTPN